MNLDLPITEFGLTPNDKSASARLVLLGDKRATTSLLSAYAYDREAVPAIGRRSVVLDGRSRKIAVIETIRVEVRRFSDVDSIYAEIEGEGDKSLAHWRSAHRAYLRAESDRVGARWSENVEVVLDYFRVVTPLLDLGDF